MITLPVVRAAIISVVLAGPALAADLPPPAVPFAARFTWTGCYLGGSAGGGWARKDLTDPVLLVQDTIGGPGTTVGNTAVGTTATGAVVGGQIGCDYQFASQWVVGVEGAALGATMKGSTMVPLPANLPDTAQVTARNDFLASATGRVGYAMDRVLLYAKGGAAWAGDKYDVTGSFTGTGFLFQGPDTRFGWTAGAGLQWAFSPHWSASLEYDYYQFGHRSVLMTEQLSGATGVLDIKQTVQVVKLGLNFHVWAPDR